MEEKTVDGDRVDGQVFNTLLDYINYKTHKLCPKIQKKTTETRFAINLFNI